MRTCDLMKFTRFSPYLAVGRIKRISTWTQDMPGAPILTPRPSCSDTSFHLQRVVVNFGDAAEDRPVPRLGNTRRRQLAREAACISMPARPNEA